MGLNLKDAMNIGGLKKCKVLADKVKLSEEIKNVTIMEVPDVTRWLKGGELLLTSFLAQQNSKEQKKLIKQLHQNKITALAIKPYHYLGEIPEFIIEEAEKYNIPIIEIPKDVSYLDILSPIMSAIFNKESIKQSNTEEFNKTLREIAMNGGTINDFIKTLESMTQKSITIESWLPYVEIPNTSLQLESLPNKERKTIETIQRPISLQRTYKDKNFKCIVAPIFIEGILYGYITCWNYYKEELQIYLSLLEQTSVLISLEFLRIKMKYDIERQYKNEFLQELLFNNSMSIHDLIERGANYHFDNKKTYSCILLSEKYEKRNSQNKHYVTFDEINNTIFKEWPYAIVGNIRDYICVFLPFNEVDETNWKDKCKYLYSYLETYLGKNIFSITGIGSPQASVQGVRSSFTQAEQALKLGQQISSNSKKIIFYDELGVYQFLGNLVNEHEGDELYNGTVKILSTYDEKRGQELVKTLESYFQNDEQIKKTASCLFIHVNTLKYRLQKISTLTGYSLSETHGKTILYLGIKIKDFFNT